MKTIFKLSSLIFISLFFLSFTRVFIFFVSPDIPRWSNISQWKTKQQSFIIAKERNSYKTKKSNWKKYMVDKRLNLFPLDLISDSESMEDKLTARLFSFQDQLSANNNSNPLTELNICEIKVKDNILGVKIYQEDLGNEEVVYVDMKGRDFQIKHSAIHPNQKIGGKWSILESQLTLNQYLPIEAESLLIGEVYLKLKKTIFKDSGNKEQIKIIKGKFKVETERVYPHYF